MFKFVLACRCYLHSEYVVRFFHILSKSDLDNDHFLNDDGSLKPGPDDVEHIVYGFGRRICVGRYFADTSVWSVIAKVLAVFKILRPLDGNGVEMGVEPRFSTGILCE